MKPEIDSGVEAILRRGGAAVLLQRDVMAISLMFVWRPLALGDTCGLGRIYSLWL